MHITNTHNRKTYIPPKVIFEEMEDVQLLNDTNGTATGGDGESGDGSDGSDEDIEEYSKGLIFSDDFVFNYEL